MATWLSRVGAASMRRAWIVIAVWVVALGGVLGGAVALGPNMQESFEIPGTESQEALDHLGSVFPQVAGTSVQVVLHADDGIEEHRDAIEAQAEEIADIDLVAQAVDPWSEFANEQIAEGGTVAYTLVQFEPSESAKPATLDEVVATADALRASGVQVEFGGQVFQSQSVGVTIVEAFGVVFAGAVLFVTFWSLLSAGMPLLTALVGVGITMGGVLGASALVTVSNSAPLMALMIGLAVGIDYALFILSRHRSQLARGMGVIESGSLAVGTSGTAVLFAGITVIVALVGLLIVNIPFLSVMAIGAAGSVAIAIAAATTLLPAIMAIAGERLRPKAGGRAHRLALRDVDEQPTLGMRWVTGISKRPVLAILGVVVVTVVAALPVASLQLALPDNGREAPGSTQRIANDTLQEAFGEGTTGPLVVMLDITQVTDVMPTIESVADELEQVPGVDRIAGAFPDETVDTAIIQVIPTTGPADPATVEVVHALRDLAPSIEAEYDTPMAVTGMTAVQIDLSQRLADALIPFGAVVVSLSVLILLLVFRSILVPLTAALGFVLSVLAAFGATVAIFQWGWGAELLHFQPGPILSFMPVLTMSVLFGLAMDYQMFLVSGMREAYAHSHPSDPDRAKSAVRHGFAANARVVTAAALIMFFVFFAFVPEGMAMIKAIAFGLAFGVAVDAFLVRMTLVPALMTLMGEKAWWLPKWLDRALPDMDVEGESLGRHRAALAWAADAGGHLALERLRPELGYELPGDASWTVTAPRGAVVRLDGAFADRQRLAHALLGETGATGHAHLGGAALPGDVATLRGRMALVDLDLPGSASHQESAHQAARAALALRSPFAVGPVLDRRATALIERASTAAGTTIDAAAPLSRLAPLERSAVLLAVAMERGPSLIWLDAATGAPAGAAAIAALLGGDEVTIVTSEASPEAHGRAAIELTPASAVEEDRAAAEQRAAEADSAAAEAASVDNTDSDTPSGAYVTTGADR